MLRKYWKLVLPFVLFSIIAVYPFIKGEDLFSNILGIDISALSFVISVCLGMMLFLYVKGDKDLEKMMNKKPTEDDLREQQKWSGRLEVIKGRLIFIYGENEKLEVNLSELKVIGEFTTEADPMAIDWYLVLVKSNNEIIYLPAYAVGFKESMKKLSEFYGEEIMPKLFASINFDSNIIYPKPLKDKKLFNFEGLNPDGIWEKIKLYLGFKPITPILRKEIMEFEN